jgi:hypothetical protein
MSGKFQSAADALGSMHEVDGVSEFIGYQIS